MKLKILRVQQTVLLNGIKTKVVILLVFYKIFDFSIAIEEVSG